MFFLCGSMLLSEVKAVKTPAARRQLRHCVASPICGVCRILYILMKAESPRVYILMKAELPRVKKKLPWALYICQNCRNLLDLDLVRTNIRFLVWLAQF